MMLIEGMKELKRLSVKIMDLKAKIGKHSADLDFETAVYTDGKAQIREWIQSATDSTARALELRIAIQKTNIQTLVKIELGGKQVEKTLAEWVHRRRDLAKADQEVWSMLTDRGLKEGSFKMSNDTVRDVKIRRYYDPAERDKMIALYREEPGIIDATLEIVNATTKIVGLAE